MKKSLFACFLFVGMFNVVYADTFSVEYNQLLLNKAPTASSGKGVCENLLSMPSHGIVARCALHTSLIGNDYFWVYTSGDNAGRCCPKTTSQVGDISNTYNISNGAFYRIEK